jgi:hypothetical protein
MIKTKKLKLFSSLRSSKANLLALSSGGLALAFNNASNAGELSGRLNLQLDVSRKLRIR